MFICQYAKAGATRKPIKII